MSTKISAELLQKGQMEAEIRYVDRVYESTGGIIKEVDPTVPAWAKKPNKPTYTASEVGARPDTWMPSAADVGAMPANTKIPSTAEDVGALPNTTVIPTVPKNVSAFENDAGYLTKHQSLDGYAKKDEVIPVPTTATVGQTIRVSAVDERGKPTEWEAVDFPEGVESYSCVPVALKDGDYNVLAINHRGYCTVAPENTIPAYILSKEKGYNYVECDVSFTSDGVAVLLHNSTIDATSNGTGSISEMTYAEALQYDFGSWKSASYAGTKIPTLEEFVILCKNIGLHPYIELKSNGAYTEEQIASIVDIVERSGMKGKVTYISFNYDYLRYVKNADSSARIGWLVYGIDNDWMVKIKALRTGLNEVFVDQSVSNVTETSINLCIENDVPVEIWTVNSTDTIESMNPYISGVTSDNLIAGKVLYEKYMTYTPPTDEDLTLTSISATYSGGDVVAGTDVNSLSGVVVTGTYSNGTTVSLSGYTLNGKIVEGENIITVTYGELTTTFTVNGVSKSDEGGGDEGGSEEGLLHSWDFTTSMVDTVSGTEALIPNSSAVNTSNNKAYRDTDGLHIGTQKDFAYILNGWAFNRTYEVDIGAVSAEYGSRHGRLLMCEKPDDPNSPPNGSGQVGYVGNGLLIYRNTGAWSAYTGSWMAASSLTNVAALANKTVKLTIDEQGKVTIYVDGNNVLSYTVSASLFSEWPHICLGCYGNAANNTIIRGMRIYEGVR